MASELCEELVITSEYVPWVRLQAPRRRARTELSQKTSSARLFRPARWVPEREMGVCQQRCANVEGTWLEGGCEIEIEIERSTNSAKRKALCLLRQFYSPPTLPSVTCVIFITRIDEQFWINDDG